MSEHPDPAAVHVTRVVQASRERVWRAWTGPEGLAAWLWPQSFATTCTFEARVGGAFRAASEVTRMVVSGEVVAVDPPAHLVLTWRWDDEPPETLVTVELHEVESGTEVHVVHERFTTTGERDDHARGWADCLDRLVALPI